MCVKDRVKVFAEYKKMTISKFEEMCDLSNGYIAAMRKGFGQEKLNNVLTAFPELNREWLLYGEGEMLKVPATLTVYNPSSEERQEIGSSSIDMSIVPAEIVEEIKAEVVAEASIPIISPDVANQPNYDVRKYLEDNASELETINPNELVKGATAAERVLRGAMQPTFIPGDVVFVRFLQNKTKITDGNIYYFDMESRPTMIRKVKIEGDKLRLIAENPDFGDVVTTFADILNVAEIVGMFRTTFTTQYSEIEAVRRKKDEHVDNLICEVSKAGARVDKMMEQMTTLVRHAIEKK